jgi:hypothetical protein
MNEKPGHPSNPSGASAARITKVYKGTQVLRDMDCPTCADAMANPGKAVPYHDASPRCESGKRPHCTCDTCF